MNASTGAFMKTIGGGQGSGPGQLNSPVGVCLLPDTSNPGSGNLLFVVDYGNHRVSVFNVLTGAFVRTIGNGQVLTLANLIFLWVSMSSQQGAARPTPAATP
jgi:hypothetical protein